MAKKKATKKKTQARAKMTAKTTAGAVRRAKRKPTPLPTQRLDRLQALAQQYQDATASEKEIKADKSRLGGELLMLMRALEAKKVEIGDTRVSTVTTKGRVSLDKIKLLKAGVSAKTIAKCESRGKSSTYVLVGEIKKPRDLAVITTIYEADADSADTLDETA